MEINPTINPMAYRVMAEALKEVRDLNARNEAINGMTERLKLTKNYNETRWFNELKMAGLR